MIKDKWIFYAISSIKAIRNGAGSVADIARDTPLSANLSVTYLAKVVADLRRVGIIDENYTLQRVPQQITVLDLVMASGITSSPYVTSGKIQDIILKSLVFPITDIW